MRNLAGVAEADTWIRGELDEAGVQRVTAEKPLGGEVPATVYGKLGPFTFRRAWYYWVVDGNVPLSVAEEMYAHPVGRRDVRVAGHCGCPPPAEWAHHIDAAGVVVIEDPDGSQELDAEEFLEMYPELREAFAERFVRRLTEVETKAVVDNYHIDSQAGLNFFAETIRRHDLDKEAT
ncbi:hypothetical protein WMF38_56920 [Sorangium sp. So ce118]